MKATDLLIKVIYTSDKAEIFLNYTPSNRQAVIQGYINGNLTYQVIRKQENN